MKSALVLQIILHLTLVLPLYAHLDPSSLSVNGGETFTASDKVEITWKMAHWHPIWQYIYFRSDSTASWTLIDSVQSQQSVLNISYEWTVPSSVSDCAQIRVFLPEFSNNPSTKTDDYTLISEPFSITSATTGTVFSHPVFPVLCRQSSVGHQAAIYDLTGRSLDNRGISPASGCLIVNRYQITDRTFSKKQLLRGINSY